jgi:hypothetical protein
MRNQLVLFEGGFLSNRGTQKAQTGRKGFGKGYGRLSPYIQCENDKLDQLGFLQGPRRLVLRS